MNNPLNPTVLVFTRSPASTPLGSNAKDRAKGIWNAFDEDSNTNYGLILGAVNNVASLSINGATPYQLTSIGPIISEQINRVNGYYYEAQQQPSWGEGKELKIKSILRLKDNKNFGCLERGVYYPKSFSELFINDSREGKVTKALQYQILHEAEYSTAFNAYVKFDYIDQSDKDNPVLRPGYASSLNGDLSSSFADLFSGLFGSNNGQTDINHLRSISGLKTVLVYDKETNEVTGLYFDLLPQSISIYPESFDAKDVVTKYLDKWNEEGNITVTVDGEEKVLTREDRDELTYTDTIQIIVNVINALIKAITISLVVFTSLSLVVSCFMIAVITYISVVERIKEIGVIRSLGGRKRDVASLFVAETFLTGLFSGSFGIAITYILQVILNVALTKSFGIAIAHLTIGTAFLMIGVSIVLSVVSGFIPSQSAAHKDPVVALRTGE